MSDVYLTSRQYASLRGLAAGLTCEQIATRMRRSTATVYRDLEAMRHEFGCHTLSHLVDRAWRLGILNAETPLLAAETPLPEVRRTGEPPALIRQRRHDLDKALRGYRRPRREAA